MGGDETAAEWKNSVILRFLGVESVKVCQTETDQQSGSYFYPLISGCIRKKHRYQSNKSTVIWMKIKVWLWKKNICLCSTKLRWQLAQVCRAWGPYGGGSPCPFPPAGGDRTAETTCWEAWSCTQYVQCAQHTHFQCKCVIIHVHFSYRWTFGCN